MIINAHKDLWKG